MKFIHIAKAKYIGIGAVLITVAAVATWAAVTVSASPVSLVTSDIKARASSEQIGLYKFGLNADSGETLSSVAVTINNTDTSVATGADFANVNIYRDDGDNILEAGTDDILVGSQATVNVGSVTTVTSAANNALPGTFFVTLATSSSWSDTSPADSATVSLAADGIVTSANSPTISVLTTSKITADTTGPVLTMVEAKDTGPGVGLNAGDSLEFTFGEATNKPVLTAAQLDSTLDLSSSHTYLDGLGVIVSETWNAEGTKLTVVLSGNVSLPTVAVGDTVTVTGSLILDALGNTASGNVVIAGSFSPVDNTALQLIGVVAYDTGSNPGVNNGDSVILTFNEVTNKPTINSGNINTTLSLNNSHSWLDGNGNISSAAWNTSGTQLTVTLTDGTSIPTIVVGETVTVSGSVIKDAANNNATGTQSITGTFGQAQPDDDDDDEEERPACSNGLLNGRIYSVTSDANFYLAAACRLKIFGGSAIGKAQGNKFQNIINLDSLDGFTVSSSNSNSSLDDDDIEETEVKSKGKFKFKLFGKKDKGNDNDD